jgi:hypothetical protein
MLKEMPKRMIGGNAAEDDNGIRKQGNRKN